MNNTAIETIDIYGHPLTSLQERKDKAEQKALKILENFDIFTLFSEAEDMEWTDHFLLFKYLTKHADKKQISKIQIAFFHSIECIFPYPESFLNMIAVGLIKKENE